MSERDGPTDVLDVEIDATTQLRAGSTRDAGAVCGPAPRAATAAIDRLELPVEVRIGRLVWPLARVLNLRVGDAVPVGRGDGDAVTLFVQGRPYAVGELIVVSGRFAFRLRELCVDSDRGDRG